MLVASNVFMTFTWCGHLKHKETALGIVVLIFWGVAFFEYWLAAPANRMGSTVYSTAQLKTMQEVITLIVFIGFSTFYLKENVSVSQLASFALIAIGAGLAFFKPFS